MKRLRAATPEEVESIKDKGDLDAGCFVVALDTQAGTALAVVRTCVEVDPVIYPDEFSDRLKLIFLRDIETLLAARGASHYYFQLPTSDEAQQYRDTMEHMGAQKVSTGPEYRYKVIL